MLQKIKNFFKSHKKLAITCMMACMVVMSAVAFADEEVVNNNAFSSTTLQPVVSALQQAITVTDIVNLFTSGVVVALPLILIWFAARWIYRRFTNAVQGGQD